LFNSEYIKEKIIMTSPEDAKKMIDDMVKKATDLAENQLTGLPKLVEKFMLSDRQIAKKIISIKSPKLSDVDLNLIVYGKDLKKELGSSYRAFVSENEKLNPRVISKDLKSSFKALEDDNPIFEEVEKIKIEVKDGLYILEQKSKAMGKDVVKLGVTIGTTIPAAAIMVAPVSFNVPGSITLIMNLINAISGINFKLKEFTPALRFLDKLKYVLPDDKVKEVMTPLNTLLSTVNTLSNTIGKLKLPNFDEAKEKAATEASAQMETIVDKVKSLKISDFASSSNPAASLAAETARLEKLKEDLSAKVEKLLK
jgi:hypothetical protein